MTRKFMRDEMQRVTDVVHAFALGVLLQGGAGEVEVHRGPWMRNAFIVRALHKREGRHPFLVDAVDDENLVSKKMMVLARHLVDVVV